MQAQLDAGAFEGDASGFLYSVHQSLDGWCKLNKGTLQVVEKATSMFDWCKTLVANLPDPPEQIRLPKERRPSEIARQQGVGAWHEKTKVLRMQRMVRQTAFHSATLL